VLDLHTVEPLDAEAVRGAAADTGAIVTTEDHLLRGGLGNGVAQTVAESRPVPLRFVAIQNRCARSGKPNELLEPYSLTSQHIASAVIEVVKQK
jgi:transketolase